MSIDWDGNDATVAAALRARGVETDLVDAALAGYAAAAVAEIAVRGLGPESDVVSNTVGVGQMLIALTPPAASVSEVLEAGIELDADDNGYRLRSGGGYLQRLSAGYPVGWWGLVKVTYDSAASDDRYDRVVVDLVKLALQFSGLDSRRDGDYAEESAGARSGGKSYQVLREELIAELVPTGLTFA